MFIYILLILYNNINLLTCPPYPLPCFEKIHQHTDFNNIQLISAKLNPTDYR